MTLIIRQDVLRGREFIIVSYYQDRVKVATATLTNDTNWTLKKAVTHKWTHYTKDGVRSSRWCFLHEKEHVYGQREHVINNYTGGSFLGHI